MIGFKPAVRHAENVVVWLPAGGSKPIPSSALIAEPPRSRAKVKLAPWTVEFLCVCMGIRTLTAGIFV